MVFVVVSELSSHVHYRAYYATSHFQKKNIAKMTLYPYRVYAIIEQINYRRRNNEDEIEVINEYGYCLIVCWLYW